jgi:hypothetical protein
LSIASPEYAREERRPGRANLNFNVIRQATELRLGPRWILHGDGRVHAIRSEVLDRDVARCVDLLELRVSNLRCRSRATEPLVGPGCRRDVARASERTRIGGILLGASIYKRLANIEDQRGNAENNDHSTRKENQDLPLLVLPLRRAEFSPEASD